VSVSPGTELLNAAKQAGVEIDSPCGTKGTCGQCVVRIISGETNTRDQGMLSQSAIKAGYVHACKTLITESDITVDIPEQIRQKGQFADTGLDVERIDPRLLPGEWQLNPLAIKLSLEIPSPQAEDGMSDLDRLTKGIQLKLQNRKVHFPLEIIRSVADALRTDAGKVTVTLTQLSDSYNVIDIKPGYQTNNTFGLAVDIGTTTVSVQLVSLPDSRILAAQTQYNEQISCGADIISRINYAQRPERLKELQEKILDTLNNLIDQAAADCNIQKNEICSTVISGNTTMIHLLLGLNPEYIRLDPYTPTLLESPLFSALEIGLEINPRSLIFISAGVGSYVGGDITAGLLCTDIVTESEEVSLFIDIGTNGEIAIGNQDFIMACACSAGPAFEGGGLTSGMRAAKGAIEDVTVNPESGVASIKVIGDTKPKGVCGSGIISLLAGLFKSGWLDSAGKLDRTRPSNTVQTAGRQAFYIIVPKEESETGADITISEADIENIIRAKAAIYSACSLLLSQLELDFTDMANIYIAGGFGHYLNLKNATTIGLLPDLPEEIYRYLGNSSLTGAYMSLISKE
ncbi:MAG: DUF4445 domain-containing protein, partial [Bacteroidetes bacterium]|nr:DUF4445 domain-containing protein [Bacteroidota bacterium]